MPSFAELWFSSNPIPKKAEQQWRRRTDFSDHAAPSAFQMEQLAYAQRAGTSLEKLRSMGLAGFVEPLDPVTEPANEKGQDNLDDDDDLRAYVSRITAAALSRAGLDSANEGEPEPAADDAETDEESDEE